MLKQLGLLGKLIALSLTISPISSLASQCDLPNVVHKDKKACDAYFEFADKVDMYQMQMVEMRDGVRLATDVYLPKERSDKVPAILLKTPYNENTLKGSTLRSANLAIDNGYAFIVQNERGRYYSEGDWDILGKPRTDGVDTLDWIVEQSWSDDQVGTLGCSSSAEWQLALAAQNHPAHKAMVPAASGAGIGRVGRFQEQGNWYKGGVIQTLFATWLYSVQQNVYPRFDKGLSQQELQRLRYSYDLAAKMPKIDWTKQIQNLPVVDWFDDIAGNEGPFMDLAKREPNDADWFKGGLYHDNEDFAVPALWLNSWYDVSVGPNMELFNHVSNNASDSNVRENQYVIVAPNLHCSFWRIPKHQDLIVGERNMGRVKLDVDESIIQWFDLWMKKDKSEFKKNHSKVQYFTMGANQWQKSDAWPPKEVDYQTFYLTSEGSANSLFGDGALSPSAPNASNKDQFTYDPMNPVPSLGGSVCCNGGLSKGGSFDQRAIEARHDVLVYTSKPLKQDTEVTGDIVAKLFVSSSAKDTDFTVKLVDVHPDGTAFNVDDTIQRAKYREGYGKSELLKPDQVYAVNFSPMTTSNLFKKGHRIRIEVSSSKFPQYMRNLNTGENNALATKAVVAKNVIYHSPEYPSQVSLPIVKN
jgi:putative CocE/NonD family hydrolase